MELKITTKSLDTLILTYKSRLNFLSRFWIGSHPLSKLESLVKILRVNKYLDDVNIVKMVQLLIYIEKHDTDHRRRKFSNIIQAYLCSTIGNSYSDALRRLHRGCYHYYGCVCPDLKKVDNLIPISIEFILRSPRDVADQIATCLINLSPERVPQFIELFPQDWDLIDKGLVSEIYSLYFQYKVLTMSKLVQEKLGHQLYVPSEVYLVNIIYAFYWLKKGGIDTISNREKVINFAESMGGLTNLKPNTNLPELFQKKFNELIKHTIHPIFHQGMKNEQRGILWKFFGTQVEGSYVPMHVLSEPKILEHVLSFI